MSFAEWSNNKKKKKEEESTTASGVSGSGKSEGSFAEWSNNRKATSSVESWADASINLIKDTQNRSGNWFDDDEYQYQDDRFTRLLSQADSWRKQHSGNSEAVSYINSVVDALSEAKNYTYSTRKYYSQWKTEDDYKSYLSQQKDYEDKKNYDLTAGQKEIDDLKVVLKEVQDIQRQLNAFSVAQSRSNTPYVTQKTAELRGRLNEITAQYGGVDSLESLVNQKSQYLNQAKHIQEGITLAGVINNDDFKDKSGYVSTKSESTWDKLTSQFGMGYDDLTYEYINGVDNGMRQEILGKAVAWDADLEKFDIYDHMTADQISTYNYYYARDGKEAAEKYLDSIRETLNYQAASERFGKIEGNTALELLFGIEAGADQFQSGMKNLFNTEDNYIPQTATHMASGMVREDLADDGFKILGNSVGQVAYDAITTTANMAPSILTSIGMNIIAPGSGALVGTAMMGASAAGNAYQEALNKGFDKDQARGYSTLVGASEAALGYLLGGISKLGGKLSNKAIAGFLSKVDNALLRTAGQLGGNMVSEFTEEYLQEVLTPIFSNLMLGTDEEINLLSAEALYSGLLGALTAGVMEGPSTISGEVNNYKTGKRLQAADISAQRLAELGQTFSADTVAHQLAGRVNEKTGAYTMGRLFNEIGATLTEQNVTEITEALVAKGMDEVNAKKNAQALAYVVEGGQLTDRQIAVIEANEVLAEVARTTLIDANTTWNQRSKGYNEVLKSLADEMTAPKAPRTNPAQQSQENAPTVDTVDTQNKEGVQSRPEAESVDTSPAKVQTISAIEKGQATVKLEDGTEVNVKQADLSVEDGVRIETIAQLEGISATDANFVLNTLRSNTGASAQMDSLGAKEVWKYGYYGFSQEHMAKNGVFANSLTEPQRKAIYETARSARQRQTEEKQATVRNSRTVESKSGRVHFEGNRGNLSEVQSASLSAMEKIADILGVQFYVFESYLNDKGERVYINDNGVESAAPNGWYAPDSGIHIDLNAGAKGEGTMLFTVAHELTHHIRRWSAAKFKVLADFLMQEYGKKGMDADALIHAQIKKAKNHGRQISYDEAYEEFVADSMETMLADGNVMKRLEKLKAQDKDLWHRIKEFIDDLAAKIRNVYKGLKADSVEGRRVAEMGNAVYRLQEMFAEALVEAGENFRSAMETVVEADAAEVTAEEIITDGAVVTDGEGKKYSLRSMKHDIAEGRMFEDLKSYCDWTQKQVDELRNNLVELVEYMTPFRDILDMNETYDMEGRRFSPYKPNSDPLYKISMDFSTLCSKRLLTQYVIENLQLRENRPMSAEEQMAIRDMLNEYRKVEKGLQVACAMCYVEAARLKSPKQITKWMEDPGAQMKNYFADKDPAFANFIKEKQADFKESRGYERDAAKKDMSPKDVRELNKIRPRLRSRYQVSAEEAKIIERAKSLPSSTYLTAGNLASLSESDPVIYAAYTAFVRTATRSKSLETDEPYYYGDSRRDNGNGIIVSDSFIEAVNRENGMRFSSWSDWRIQHLLDYITAVIDNSVRGAAMHGYTKFGEEVRVLGKTGMMFNMSGVAGTQTGLNEDGSLSFSPTESIDKDEAVQLREEFPETAGLQCIGVGDEHIVELLRSDIIDYVIPYHVSGLNAGLRAMANIHGWKDYTSTQHAAIDKSIKFENAADQEHWHEEPVYSEFFVGYDTGMTGIEAMRASAERYVQMCKDRGLKPKFEQFVKEENYWKLLIDRKMVNQKTGNLIRQKPVTPAFDFKAVKAVVDRFVENYDSGLEARALNQVVENWDSIPKRIRDLKKQGSAKAKKASKAVDTLANQTLAAQPAVIQDDIKYSDRDSDGNQLSEDQQEFFKDSKVRDKKGNLLIVYHGTTANFNVFKKGDVGFHFGTKGAARGRVGYGKNVNIKAVYLNITNPIVFDEDLGSWDADYRLTRELHDRGILTMDEAMSVLRTDDGRFKRSTEAANKKLASVLQAKGYDGIAYQNTFETKKATTSYIAFSSNQAKETTNIRPTSNPDIRFSYRDEAPNAFNPDGKTLDEQLDEILDTTESFDGRYLYIGRFTPAFIDMVKKYVDIEELPIAMNYRDAYLSMQSKENGKYKGDGINYHNIGKEGMKSAIESFDRPEQVLLSKKDGKIELVLEGVDRKGNRLLSVVALNTSTRNAQKFIEAHIVTSIYGKRSIERYVSKAESEGRLIYTKKEEPAQGISQVQYEGNINADSFKTIVLDGTASVKYQDRDSESISNRSLLANAFEGVAQNDIEKQKLQEYKDKIGSIEAEERKLHEIKRKIKSLSFRKGPRDTNAISKLQDEATKTANRISTFDKQLLRLEASKPLKAVVEREKQKAYRKAEKKGMEALDAYRERSIKSQQALANKWEESRKKGVESRQSSYVRSKIKAFKARLESSLLSPTDRRYVPIDLIKAMVEVCGLIDTDTELYNADGSINKAQEKRNLTKEKLQNLKDEYEKLKTHSDPIYAGEFDEMVYTYLTELRDKFSGKNLREMNLDELTEMYETLRAIEETLQDARKLIGWGDAENVYEAGDAIVSEQNKITQSRKGGKRNAVQIARDKSLNLSLSPVRNVERMSGYNQDSYLLKLFKKFEQGIRKKNKFVMEAYKSFESLTSGKEYDDAVYKEVGGKKYTDINGRKFGVSKMQMMQAILSHERETANGMHHIENSGFSFADLNMLQKGRLRDAISEEHSHRVPAAVELVAEFTEALNGDKWCQDYMKAARKFFNGTAKDAINETSISLKHRIIAKDKSYIPFEVDKNFVVREISAENDIQQTINSYGMLKETKKGASQPLIITGLNNILDRHIDQVGNVYGLAIEVRNFNKVWNVRSLDAVGNDPTVKAIIQRNWGYEGVKHIEQAVQDIQGPRHSEQSALYKKVKSGYIGATFLLNLSVVTKQIGSLYSATSMLKWRGPVRQVGNLLYTMVNHKKISAEVDKYTATAWMRRQGLSDAELHTFMTEGKKSLVGRLVGKLPAVFNPGKWITAMDSAVALSLWRYAKIDTAKRTGLKGEELLKATAEFYDDVIENTQSMTDVLHRPEIQKRSDILSESLGMFKTDLYQMAGQLHVTAGRFTAKKTKENGMALGRTVYAIAMSAVWAQLMTTVFALLRYKVNQYRDDEDEELTYESWLKRQGFSFAGDLMGYIIPIFGSELVGVFENIMYGESEEIVDSIALTAINDLYDTMITVGSAVKDGEMPNPAVLKKFTTKALQVFGIPASNILRTYEAIQLHAKDIANGKFLSFEAGVDRSPKHHIHRIVEAMEDGRTDVAIGLYEEALEETAMGKTEDGSYGKSELNDAKTSLQTALGDKYKDGEISEKQAVDILVVCFGFDREDAEQKVRVWGFKTEYGFDYNDKKQQFMDGNISASELKDILVEVEGKTDKEANSNIVSYTRDAYEEGYFSRSQAASVMVTYGGLTKSEAESKLQYIDVKKALPDTYVDDAWVAEYYEEVVSSGISIEAFVDYRNQVKGITGDGKKERRMTVINSLPITSAQKDALYYAEGWAASKIYEAPWH